MGARADHDPNPERAGLLAGRHVAVVMDCDRAGRIAAGRVAGDLQAAGAIARMVDLAPGRDDGYDLTDWLVERDSDPPACLLAALRLLVIDRQASGRAVS